MPAFPAPPPESFNLPGFSDLWNLLENTPFGAVVNQLDGYVEALEKGLELADKVAFLFPTLRPELEKTIAFLHMIHGALHKTP